jgi:hypothetical protein
VTFLWMFMEMYLKLLIMKTTSERKFRFLEVNRKSKAVKNFALECNDKTEESINPNSESCGFYPRQRPLSLWLS